MTHQLQDIDTMTPEVKRFQLAQMLRTRSRWVVDQNPQAQAYADAVHAQMEALKSDLGITDEAAFLADQSKP